VNPIRTSFESPWQNGVAERWVGSCRRDLHLARRRDPVGGVSKKLEVIRLPQYEMRAVLEVVANIIAVDERHLKREAAFLIGLISERYLQ